MIQTQPIEVADFSGGIVDDYINGRANQMAIGNNVIPLEDKSLLMRPGSEIWSETDAQIPAGVQKIRTLINFRDGDTLFVQSGKRFYYRNPVNYANLVGPSGNDAFDTGDAESIASHTQWKGFLYATSNDFAKPVRIYRDNTNTLKLRSAGLPKLATNPVVTPGIISSKAFIYAFHYSYSYYRDQELFYDASAVTQVEVTASGDPSVNPNTISAIPVLANGATGNWDTTVIKVEIYRTIDAGQTFYKVGEITNGTTVFVDNVSDTLLSDNPVIYTDGNIVDNDEPPKAKFIHVVQNRMYYGYLQEGLETKPYDLLQSIDGDPDSVPATFRDTVEDVMTGLHSVREVPIVLCKKHIYRIEGIFDEQGRGFMAHVRIHDTAGCVANNSCVQAEQGMYWWGNDGIYYTDGYKAFKVTDQINDSYKEIIRVLKVDGELERITGTFDPEERRILWSVQRDTANDDNDTVIVLELRYGVSDQMPVYTWDGGENFKPSAIAYFNGDLYRADTRGYVFRHDFTLSTDPKVDTSQPVTNWAVAQVIYKYRSVATNFGTDFVRKWVPRLLMTLKNKSNISVQINVINDDGKSIRELAQIRYRNNFTWGDPEFIWGNPDCVWNAEGLIQEWRRLPAKGLRLSYFQAEVTNAYTVVTNSDTLGTALVDNTLKTATLTDAINSDWPLEAVDYYISFESDNYEREYLVTSRGADTLVFSDLQNTAPNGTYKWLLKGYRKNEFFNLLSYTVHYAMLSKTHTNLAGQGTGANA
jgi:hypothetical protein